MATRTEVPGLAPWIERLGLGLGLGLVGCGVSLGPSPAEAPPAVRSGEPAPDPGSLEEATAPPPRRIVWVLDTTASMDTLPAREAARETLAALGAEVEAEQEVTLMPSTGALEPLLPWLAGGEPAGAVAQAVDEANYGSTSGLNRGLRAAYELDLRGGAEVIWVGDRHWFGLRGTAPDELGAEAAWSRGVRTSVVLIGGGGIPLAALAPLVAAGHGRLGHYADGELVWHDLDAELVRLQVYEAEHGAAEGEGRSGPPEPTARIRRQSGSSQGAP